MIIYKEKWSNNNKILFKKRRRRSYSIKLLNVYNFNFITILCYKVFYYKHKICQYNYQISSLIDTNIHPKVKILGIVECI